MSRLVAMEQHILNLYEDLDMSFKDLMSLSRKILIDDSIEIQEKMDGQNLTFTIKDGHLKIFGKRIDQNILESRGATWDTIDDNYSEITREGFRSAYFILESHLSHFSQKDLDTVFKNGKVVIESAMITPIVPVTIRYLSNYVRFIRPFSPYGSDISSDEFINAFLNITSSERFYEDHVRRVWSVGPVPKLSNIASIKEKRAAINTIREFILSLLDEYRETLHMNSTFQEYATLSMVSYISNFHPTIPKSIRKNVARRITAGKKKEFTVSHVKNLFPLVYREIWNEIKLMEENSILALSDSIIGLEQLIQKIGTVIFDCFRFQLATDYTQINELKGDVRKIIDAREYKKISVINVSTGDINPLTKKWKMKLDVGIRRAELLETLRKPVEGIVFMTDKDDQPVRRKLTGMFTAIHRLSGLFKFTTSGERLIIT